MSLLYDSNAGLSPLRLWRGVLVVAAAWFVCAGSAAAKPPAAADPFEAVEALGPGLPDERLADLRGKFIRSDAISFFGISMMTHWRDQSGAVTLARLLLNVDFRVPEGNAPLVSVLVGWNRSGDPTVDVSHASGSPYLIVSPGEGLGGVDTGAGAAQINALAGSDNVARNNLQIIVLPAEAIGEHSDASLSALTETQFHSFPDGDTLEFRMASNQIGIVMTGNSGIDTSLQSVGGDLGMMIQQTILNSDHNSIFNSAAITFGASGLESAGDNVRLTEALSAMHGHGF